MKNQKRQFTPEFKVQVIREQLENQIPIGRICEQFNIKPSLFHLWKREFFAGAVGIFMKKKSQQETAKLARLEEKLKDKDSLISEIVEDNLRLKKKLSGAI